MTRVTTLFTTTDSPVGELLLVGEESGTAPGGLALASLSMAGGRGATLPPQGRAAPAAFGEVEQQLREYFAGRRTRFGLEYVTPHGSAFQHRVWQALDQVPYGTTTTYGELARSLGIPRQEVRALGAAVGANPLLLVRPCHRVIGADGSLRGYAGGVERKVALLTHEGALQPMLA
ncbi:methylated-DNA--[protein]-cysteine S-methyltransferase [Streptomyces sp. WAC06614]|uniref:methylated-DNA--[protein]-cysteine S-methyltransferase n=1 Tax=Streptomyces sp. WAC06614 TaxID=2487416 RepID=UPI000F78F21D|nr:methylated-DNA--[protein]-cysteine S-methyltransferase [Streptomyces sp. WAC06614]RSS80393.1 methylated-DNA--[protein]-cysteine S-methyltransferase [Streptomyces sp. WAC06614]